MYNLHDTKHKTREQLPPLEQTTIDLPHVNSLLLYLHCRLLQRRRLRPGFVLVVHCPLARRIQANTYITFQKQTLDDIF